MAKRFRQEHFSTQTPSSYPTPHTEELFEAILSLKNKKEAQLFFRDLLTMAEIEEFANRWQVVKLLIKGNPYLEISQKLGVSTTTVSRVAYWFFNGYGGYQLMAARVFSHLKKTARPFRLRGKYTFLKNPFTLEK